jgi:hemoglobin
MMEQQTQQQISEQEISELVDKFYAKVRQDEEIGPIFNAVVDDWPYHLALLKNFWSTVLNTTGRYKGDPMMKHLQLSLDPPHFRRWLELFEETARETMQPDHAELVVWKAERIAQNFMAGIAYVKGQPAL